MNKPLQPFVNKDDMIRHIQNLYAEIIAKKMELLQYEYILSVWDKNKEVPKESLFENLQYNIFLDQIHIDDKHE
jgi:hypothetical protein